MTLVLAFFLAFNILTTGPAWLALADHAQTQSSKSPRTVHFSLINMSGTDREARIRRLTVPLPIAEQVAFQLPEGNSISIVSDTDHHVSRTIQIVGSDEGHLFTVD